MLRFIPNNKGFKKDLVLEASSKGEVLRIGILDADLLGNGTRHPNLALLKISGYCKSLGHQVELIKQYEELLLDEPLFINENKYDLLILSKVFKFNHFPSFIQKLIDDHYIYYGGTGFLESSLEDNFFLSESVPDLEKEVEHFKPDYSLYTDFIEWKTNGDPKKKKRDWDDYLSFSIGFTTRGCIRHCAFCVNRLSSGVSDWSPVNEFIDSNRPKIYLWDDNIMAAPAKIFAKVMTDLKNQKKPFQFRQGMDIRLMTKDKAKLLNEVKYYGDYIFAFDHYKTDTKEEKRHVDQTIRGLKVWREYCKKSTKLYVLVAFDAQDETDIEGTFFRIKTLMEFGCLPYIMRFEKYSESRFKNMYIQLARWCNQPSFFKKMSFRQYCVRNEEYHQGIQYDHKGKYATKLVLPAGFKGKPKHCLCYQTMLDFEEEFPELAKKYFDLRFEDLNPYKICKR